MTDGPADRRRSADPDGGGIDRRTLLVVTGILGGAGVLALASTRDGDGGTHVDPDLGAPNATFEFAYLQDSGVVEITHAGGREFTAENTEKLSYGVFAEDRTFAWTLPVDAGDQVRLDVASGDLVEVIWHEPAGDRTESAEEFEVP